MLCRILYNRQNWLGRVDRCRKKVFVILTLKEIGWFLTCIDLNDQNENVHSVLIKIPGYFYSCNKPYFKYISTSSIKLIQITKQILKSSHFGDK